MYIMLPFLETLNTHTHFAREAHTHMHTYLDMHGRHDVCVSDVFVHMCVCVCVWGVYQLTQTDSGDTLVLHSLNFLFFQWWQKKKNNKQTKKKCVLAFKNYCLGWSLPFLNESPYHTRVVLSSMLFCYLADDVMEAEPWPHAVVGFRPLAVVFIQYLFNLSFC